jgi:DNA ligase-1
MFDLLTVDEWNAMKCDRSTTDRKCVLREMFPSEWVASRTGQTSTRHIVVVPSIMVATEAQVEHLLGQFMAEGYEGAVLKNPDAPYIFDRSGYWVKIKPQQEADLEIYDVEEGEGRLRNCVGAIKVRGKLNYKGRIYEIDTRVGTGLSDAVRNRMWDLHNAGQLAGKTAEIKFQDVTEVTLSSASSSVSPGPCALRFPVYLRMREDK